MEYPISNEEVLILGHWTFLVGYWTFAFELALRYERPTSNGKK